MRGGLGPWPVYLGAEHGFPLHFCIAWGVGRESHRSGCFFTLTVLIEFFIVPVDEVSEVSDPALLFFPSWILIARQANFHR